MPRKQVDDSGLVSYEVATMYLTHESTRALLCLPRANKDKRKGKGRKGGASNLEGQESEEEGEGEEEQEQEVQGNAERLSGAALGRAGVMIRRVRRWQELKDPGLVQRHPWHEDSFKRYLRALCMDAVRNKRDQQGYDITRGTILEDAIGIEERVKMSHAIWMKGHQRE